MKFHVVSILRCVDEWSFFRLSHRILCEVCSLVRLSLLIRCIVVVNEGCGSATVRRIE